MICKMEANHAKVITRNWHSSFSLLGKFNFAKSYVGIFFNFILLLEEFDDVLKALFVFKIVKLRDEENRQAILDKIHRPANTQQDWACSKNNTTKDSVDDETHNHATPEFMFTLKLPQTSTEWSCVTGDLVPTQISPKLSMEGCANFVLPCDHGQHNGENPFQKRHIFNIVGLRVGVQGSDVIHHQTNLRDKVQQASAMRRCNLHVPIRDLGPPFYISHHVPAPSIDHSSHLAEYDMVHEKESQTEHKRIIANNKPKVFRVVDLNNEQRMTECAN